MEEAYLCTWFSLHPCGSWVTRLTLPAWRTLNARVTGLTLPAWWTLSTLVEEGDESEITAKLSIPLHSVPALFNLFL
jgi:hypothetical protein